MLTGRSIASATFAALFVACGSDGCTPGPTEPPNSLTYATNPAVYTVGTAITPNTPSSSGGTVASYSVAPAVPAGLSLNTTTGVIGGTPTAVTATATYTVTATNTGGRTTAILGITVNATVVPTYTVGGTVSGLAGSGLVLSLTLGESLPVAASGPFTFTSRVASGTAYAVTVATQPTSPGQTCVVANGSGTIAGADVSNVAVTCTTNTYTLGGTVSGLTAAGLRLASSAGSQTVDVPLGATSYVFPTPVASGSSYAITVAQQPSGSLVCAVANPSGAVGSANVTNANVTCLPAFSVSVSVSGLGGSKQVVLQDNGGDSLTVTSNGTFPFATRVASGSPYQVTVLTHPADQACMVTNGSGTISANVTATVSCADILVQRWRSPTTWGARWPSTGTMVQHAWFDGTALVEGGAGVAWGVQGTARPQQQLTGLPSGARWGAGPFGGDARWRYQTTSDASIAALTGDFLVCAVMKPYYNIPTSGQERSIIAKGYTGADALVAQPNGGWVLLQSHEQFNFHYHYTAPGCDPARGDHCYTMVYTPPFFADQNFQVPGGSVVPGPLNPSYLVACAGREGDTIRTAVNSLDTLAERWLFSPSAVLDLGVPPVPTTIGGYATVPDPSCSGSPYPCQDNDFLGVVYETAIWNEPASAANIQAKLAAFQGLVLPDGSLSSYHRNREGPYVDASGGYHTTWRHGPRLDATKGMLFGGQAWNRVSWTSPYSNPADSEFHPFDIFVPGEDAGLWTPAGGATVDPNTRVAPPGDGGQPSASQVTLPAGGSLTTTLGGPFDAAGSIQGQLWIRPVSGTGAVSVVKSAAQGGGSSQFDIDLGRYPAGQWSRVWLTGLTTDGTAGNVTLRNGGSGPLVFYVWGLSLTQLAGGGAVGTFDPGPWFYDWSSREGLGYTPVNVFAPVTDSPPQDALQLPSVAISTASSGFCLSVDAQPLPSATSTGGLAWDAAVHSSRTALTWASDSTGDTASIYVNGIDDAPNRQVCFRAGATTRTCAAVPSSWAPGTKHNLKGCISASGQLRLFGDDVLLGAPVPGAPAIDLSSGHLLVGNVVATPTASTRPWHGWISSVVACKDPGDAQIAACR